MEMTSTLVRKSWRSLPGSSSNYAPGRGRGTWTPPCDGAACHCRYSIDILSSLSIRSFNMSEGLFFNVTSGYIEGIVRGYRNTLLTGQQYNNLTQCETIDGPFALPSNGLRAND